MSKKVSMSESIVINASPDKLFDYILNGNNDPKWRTEVDRISVQEPLSSPQIVPIKTILNARKFFQIPF